MLCVNKEESVSFGAILEEEEEEDDKTCAPWWSSEYFLVFVLSGTMSHFPMPYLLLQCGILLGTSEFFSFGFTKLTPFNLL
jgi:hypothetical protein